MAEVLGIVSIVDNLVNIGKELRRCIKTLCHAKEEVEDIREQTEIFWGTLEHFHEAISQGKQVAARIIDGTGQQKLLFLLCRKSKRIIVDLRRLLKKLRPLRRTSNTTRISRLRARVHWLFRKSSTVPLSRSMHFVTASLDTFISTLLLKDKLDEQEKLRRAGELVPHEMHRKM